MYVMFTFSPRADGGGAFPDASPTMLEICGIAPGGGARRRLAAVRWHRAGRPCEAAPRDRAGHARPGALGRRVPLPPPQRRAGLDAGALHAADRPGRQPAVARVHQRHHAAPGERRAAPQARLPRQQQPGFHRHVRPRGPAALRQRGGPRTGRARRHGRRCATCRSRTSSFPRIAPRSSRSSCRASCATATARSRSGSGISRPTSRSG